mmetsp:Transcript_139235/g.445038  ORF Transcript_139235/g.445038 Transcript_139235/m.445038 type:complete len:242 (+) Transcript_139235:964-1689(+)
MECGRPSIVPLAEPQYQSVLVWVRPSVPPPHFAKSLERAAPIVSFLTSIQRQAVQIFRLISIFACVVELPCLLVLPGDDGRSVAHKSEFDAERGVAPSQSIHKPVHAMATAIRTSDRLARLPIGVWLRGIKHLVPILVAHDLKLEAVSEGLRLVRARRCLLLVTLDLQVEDARQKVVLDQLLEFPIRPAAHNVVLGVRMHLHVLSCCRCTADVAQARRRRFKMRLACMRSHKYECPTRYQK